MAREVDTRVVEMQFDNKRFEENARESMSTLEKLKQALNFDNLRNSFKNLTKSAGEVSVDGLDKGLDTVNAKFSALQVVGMTALANITNSAIEAGKKIASALTIDPIRSGFGQYESKIKSMNVLVHALEGRNTEKEIDEAIEGLYDYANDTIYNPQNMIDTLSKLANADKTRDAKELTNVIKGFGNMAALAGAGAQEFNRGVYNLSQAMSTGKMTAIDWKSFENANLATNELKDLFVETATELGTLKKGTELYDTAVQDFRGSLQKGWLTSEVMLQTLSKYNDETTEFGRKAMEAGSRVKNFSELMDSLGESITSGWARTIEVVFGDMHELSDLLTVVNNIVGGFLDNMAKERLDLLKSWKDLGGRDAAIDALANSFLALKSVIDPIRQAFRDVFPKLTAERLVELTENIRDFTAQMRISGTTANSIYNTFKGLFTILKIGADLVLGVAKFALPPIAFTIQLIAKSLLFLTGILGSGISALTNWVKSINLGAKALKLLTTILKGAATGVLLLVEGLVMAFEWLSNLPIVRTAVDLIEKAVDGIKALISKLLELTGIKLSNIPKSLKEAYAYIKQIASTIKNSKLVTTLTGTVSKVVKSISATAKELGERLGVAKDGIVKFLKELRQGYKDFGPKGLFSVLVNKVKEFKETIQNGGLFGNLFTSAGIENAKEHMQEFVESVREFASTLTPGRVAAFAFSVAIISMAGAINKAAVSISGIGTGIKTFFKNINNTLLAMGRKSAWMQDFALMIGVLAASLTLLTSLPHFERLTQVAWTLGILITVVGALTIVMEKMSMTTTKDGKIIAARFDQLATTLLSLAVSAGVLAGALYLIQDINTTDLWKKVLALVASMAGMAVIAGALGSRVKEFSKGSIFLLAFAGATKMVVTSLVALKELDATSLKDNLMALAAIMLGMGVLAAGAGQIRLTSVIGIVALSQALNYCVPVLEDIANMDISGLKKGVENTLRSFAEMVANIADTITTFLGYDMPEIGDAIRKNGLIIGLTTITGVSAVLIKLLDKAGKAIRNAGTGFLAISGAIYLLTFTAERLKNLNMSVDQIEMATTFISKFFIFFSLYGLLMGVVARVDKDSKSMAGSIAWSMLALTASITALTWLVESMKNLKIEDLATGMYAIAGVSSLLTALIYVAGKAGAVSLKSISAMIVGLAFIFGELIVLSTFKWEELAPAVGAISTILISLGVCMALVRGFGKQAKTYVTWKSIAAMVAGLTVAVAGLYALKGTKIGELLPTMVAISAIMIVLGVVFAKMTKATKDMNIGTLWMFVNFAGMLGMVIGALAILSTQAPWNVIASAIAMVAGLAGIVGAIVALDKWVKDTSKITKLALAVLMMSESLVVVAAACAVFDTVSWEGLGKAGAALLALSVIVGLLALITKNVGTAGKMLAGGAAFLEIAASLYVVAKACEVFNTVDSGAVWAAVGSLTAMTVALGLLTLIVGAFGPAGVAVVLAVGAAFALLGVAMTAAGVGMMAGAKAIEWLLPSLWQLDDMFKAGLPLSLHIMAQSLTEVALAGTLLIGAGLGFLSFGAGLIVFSLGAEKLIGLDMLRAVNNLTLFVSAAKVIEQSKITFTMIKTAAGVALLGGALLIFVSPLEKLNRLKLRDIAASLTMIFSTLNMLDTGMIVRVGGAGLALSILANVLFKMNQNSKKTNKMLSGLSENLLNLATSLQELSKNKFVQAGEDAVTGLVEGLQNKSDNAKIAFGVLGLACLGGFSDTTGWHSPWIEMIRAGLDACRGLIQGLAGGEGSAKDAFANFGSNMVSAFGGTFESLTGEGGIVQKLTGNFGGMNELLGEFGINLGGVTDSLGSATEEMDEFGDSVGEATLDYEDLTEAIANSLDIFAEFDKKTDLTMDQLLKNMHSQIVGISEWADDLRILGERGIDKGLLAYLANLGPQGFEYVNAFIHASEEQLAIASDLYRTSLTIPSTAADQITNSYYDIGYDSGESSIEGLSAGMEENTEEAEEAAIGVSSAVIGAFKSKEGFDINSPSHKAEAVGNDVIEGLAKGIREGKGSDIKSGTISVSKMVIKTLTSALSPNEFKTIGTNVTKGLTIGLNAANTTSMVLKACDSLGKGILSKLRKVLGINSPSTEAIKIGEFFDEGLIVGLKSYSNRIFNTSEDAGNYAIDGMKQAVEKINDISFNYIDTNPTIKPVLDISDVVNGANDMNSLFGAARLSADITGKANTMISEDMLNRFNAVAAGMNSTNDILGEMRLMRNQINELSESMSEMQMVMDTGAIVGQLAKPMDSALGTRAIRNRREKI